MNRLAVFCGSSTPADPRYLELARDVGEELARRGIGVVYGGGKLGLMGALADGAMAAGGEVIGVIPDAMVQAEVANLACSELREAKIYFLLKRLSMFSWYVRSFVS